MATRRRPSARAGNPWEVPRIVSLDSRLAQYAPAKIFFVGPEKREVRQAVEVTIETASPIPTRAISPVIWIGDTPLVEMEALGHNRYKFYAFEQTALPEGATIAFGWPAAAPQHEATSAQRVATNFRFRLGGSPSGVA